MTVVPICTLDELGAAAAALPPDRQAVLREHVEGEAMTEAKKPKQRKKRAAKPSTPDVLNPLHYVVESDPQLRTFTLEQIADAYSVSVRSLQRYIAAGELRVVRIGRKYGVTLAALREFLRERESKSADEAKETAERHGVRGL